MRQWKVLLAIMIAGAVGLAPYAEATAQIGQLLGSPHGSICKFRSRERVRVASNMPEGSDLGYMQRMTLRRLADMAHSRGYDAFVTQEEECEAYLLNGSEYSRSCRYEATMSNVADPTEEMADEETAYLVAEIFALTDSERSSYPRPTGIFLRGNDCLFD